MNFLGMGPAELLLIFVIALIVFGPGRLPELARTLGKAMRQLRRMSTEVTAEFAKELRDVEAVSREVKETTEAIKQAADIRALVETVEPAPSPSESEEDTESSDIPETPTQVEAETNDTAGDEKAGKGERG
jgi:Tat protein translocase TatB subunit